MALTCGRVLGTLVIFGSKMKIFDLHIDLSAFCTTNGRIDLSGKAEVGGGFFPDQVDIPRLNKGGVRAILGNICPIIASSKGFEKPKDGVQELFRQLAFYLEQDRRMDSFSLVRSVNNLKRSGISVLLSLEGAYCIQKQEDLYFVPILKRLGFVSIAPTWSLSNALGTGTYDIDSEKGLTKLGRSFIELCETNKIAVDAVHTSRKTFWDIAEVTRRPFLVSHTASFEVTGHRRNLTKEQIKVVAERGGLVGLCFVRDFLGGPSIDFAVKNLKSLVNFAGIDHVSIGSDFDGMSKDDLVEGLEDVSKMPRFFDACLKDGFTHRQLEKIAWGNSVRFFKEVVG